MNDLIVPIFAASTTIGCGLLLIFRQRLTQLRRRIAELESSISVAREEVESAFASSAAGLEQAQALVTQQIAGIANEKERVRKHYEAALRESQMSASNALDTALGELAELRKYKDLLSAEMEAQEILAEAIKEAEILRSEAQGVLDKARTAFKEYEDVAEQRRNATIAEAAAVLGQASREAEKTIAHARVRAEEIAGDAYFALQERVRLEKASEAIKNTIDGYGDRYVLPTRSVVDELAADFGHLAAGQSLAAARLHSRNLILEDRAATCEYVEANRRETAIRFVVDAFNGRVDAILSRAKHDNYGTMEQEFRDAFSLVNLNGSAFREARVTLEYLDARLAELKWTVATEELKRRTREEQRRIKEQIREEEKVRRDFERVMKETLEEEERLREALAIARKEAETQGSEERMRLEQQITALNARLVEAEEKNQRALSMAQQTRRGSIYIISNHGSLGHDVLKIGMTRRLDPMDRIWELSDASVPFDFDVHAIIPCDDAPAMERYLHEMFDEYRINRINFRKEFFRVPLTKIRETIASRGIEASFTMAAENHEYRETLALERMTVEERQRYLATPPAAKPN